MTDNTTQSVQEQVLAWADGEYKFALRWPDLIRIEADTDTGPLELLMKMQRGEWLVQEIASVIRHALIGGGLDQNKAGKLVATYVESLPPETSLPMASGLLYTGVFGFNAAKAAAEVKQARDQDYADLHANQVG